MLRVSGKSIVDSSGNPVILRGFGIGGWLHLENFMTGFPGQETPMRQAMLQAMGQEAYDAFYDSYYKSFFNQSDMDLLKSMGMNCIRVPIHYRMFESDDNPFEIIPAGVKLLDDLVEMCENNQMYLVIDMHAVPGHQNHHWHSDNPTHWPFFWEQRQFQDRVVWMWKYFADRYKNKQYVAGYNLLNEPADEQGKKLVPFYERLIDEVRQVDPHHMVFLDANTYSTDFSVFGQPFENAVYASHDYALAGLDPKATYPGVLDGSYPGSRAGQVCDYNSLVATFEKRCAYQLKHGVPMWIGEFGPVYTGNAPQDEGRYRLLEDQLKIYAEAGAGWSLWTYKDIGMQGVAYAKADSDYMQLVAPMITKKKRLGADSWGGSDAEIRSALAPLEDLFLKEFPTFDPYPWGQKKWLARIIRHVAISEALVPEYGQLFAGCSPEKAAALAADFDLSKCVVREKLRDVLTAACK